MNLRLAGIVAALFVTHAALAQEDMRTVEVAFPAGTSGTSITDSITGYESVLYKVAAASGQRMDVTMAPSNNASYFNVYAPGNGPGDEALAISSMMGSMVPDLNVFSGTLPQTGVYTISVYMMRSAARRDEVSDYRVDISIDGASDPGRADFADGMTGGPDVWQVTVSGGDLLNLRDAPTTVGTIVARLADGTQLRNLGCEPVGGGTWCRVATLADPGEEGWVSARFLREGSGQVTAAPSGTSETVRVRFEPGTSGTELRQSLASGAERRCVIGASDGQNLYVRVAADAGGLTYGVENPDGSALLDQIEAAQEYRGQLWQSGDYVVVVRNPTGTAQDYNIVIGIR